MSDKTSVRTSNTNSEKSEKIWERGNKIFTSPPKRNSQSSKKQNKHDSTIHGIGVLLKPFSKVPCFPKKY